MDEEKKCRIADADIKQLVSQNKAGIATDRIMVDGEPVRIMYREESAFEEDSGWRFFAGDESEKYVADDNNLDVYALNTIANYDQTIVELLDQPEGSEFQKDADGKFLEIKE